ncbi:MAG: DUF5343 domain-containing protein, partial [Thaumarchaeota archaeon]|nr:DUF5343 domain-containing protein [Nitrososphaerota archaeon]
TTRKKTLIIRYISSSFHAALIGITWMRGATFFSWTLYATRPLHLATIFLRNYQRRLSMANQLPYVNRPPTMVRIFAKVKEAKTPERFTVDFLETKLGFRGGTSRPFIPLAKKLGFLNSDGTPTDLYNKFRNDRTSKTAMAQALRTGYRELFERNEYANSLKHDDFRGLVVEVTGLDSKSRTVQLICQTFDNLKSLADFEGKLTSEVEADAGKQQPASNQDNERTATDDVGLNLSYSINLVLPKTDDPAVFNAIFKSLRDNLLRR